MEKMMSDFFDPDIDLVGSIDKAGNFRFISLLWQNVLGEKLEELNRKGLQELKSKQNGVICSILSQKGEMKWFAWRFYPSGDKTLAVALDITASKESDRFQTVLNKIQAGTWEVLDLKSGKMIWSPQIYEILGYEENEIHSTFEFIKQSIHPEDAALLKQRGDQLQADVRMLCKNGKYKWLQIMGVNLNNRLLGLVIDIHQKKLMDTQAEEGKQKNIQASKLATLGEMAAGVAHEVNNPLTIIFGYIRMLEEEMKNNPRAQELLKHVKAAAVRAQNIVIHLKDFALDSSHGPYEDVKFTEIMELVLDLSQERFKQNDIKLEIDLQADPVLHGRKTELAHVLLSLLFNSFDAIKELSPQWVKLVAIQENSQLIISVLDSGHGLVPEVAEKIFTPFFTTKRTGLGVGLSLSISQRIMQGHGGEIFYDSSSLNTKFIVKIPLPYELSQD